MDSTNNIPVKKFLENEKVAPEILNYIPKTSAAYYQLAPVGLKDGVLEVGMLDPNNLEARDALQFIASKLGLPFKIFSISKSDYDKLMQSYEGLTGQVSNALGDLSEDIKAEEDEIKEIKGDIKTAQAQIIEDAPVTKIVAVILQHATEGNASDIHIEPTGANVKVRFRVDGALYTSLLLPSDVHDAVVARIKILTNMKLDERRKPQDGRFSAKIEKSKVDFRVSTLPTYFGEKVVIRILDPEHTNLNLGTLGLSEKNLGRLRNAISRPYGMILITGPTGSGKTTTLYAMLNELDREKNNIVSLEDPVEYNIPGINQSQVQPEINYTFANGLRSILRQDPDIIMVGEIRDGETAKLAIQAALTGHLVLATLHTNNTAGVVPRLIDMGVDAYLIAATLILAVAQRLVPLLCPDSKESITVDGAVKVMIEKTLENVDDKFRKEITIPHQVYRSARSPTCPGGTKGRMAVVEIMEVNPEIEKAILENPTETEIYRISRAQGLLSMKEDALLKVFEGVVPFEEVSKL